MIAYLDAEYNSNRSRTGETDMSVIEIALAICPGEKSKKTACQYHAFVKPIKNGGIIYKNIKELTGITQEDVDNGKSFPQVIKEINQLLVENKVKKVYTWGGSDKPTLKWNFKQHKSLFKRDEILLRLMEDVSESISRRVKSETVLSLKNMALICNCNSRGYHNALDDALTLRDVVQSVTTNNYDRDNLKRLKKYRKQKQAFAELRRAMRMVERAEADPEEYFRMIAQKKDFPPFNYTEKKQ